MATTHLHTILRILMLAATIGIQPMQAQHKATSTQPKIGLVLGGGGAKGAAEIGVLKVLEEEGIKIDYIAGTSIGSIIGGLYSIGYRADDLDSLFNQQSWLDLLSDRKNELAGKPYEEIDGVSYVFGFPILRKRQHTETGEPARTAESSDAPQKHTRTVGLIHGDNIISLLDSMTGHRGDINFDQLPIPFSCVAVDIRKMEEVVITNGNLPLAMRASMAIPGAFKPVEVDSMLLVDGGLLNNLPVDVVRQMGADIVIAIDLTQNHREPREDYDRTGHNTITRMIGWLINRPDLQKYSTNCKDADIYINPDLHGFDAASFTTRKISEMIRRGKEAADQARPQIIQLKKTK